MAVDEKLSQDWRVEGNISKLDKALSLSRRLVAEIVRSMVVTRNPVLHSPSIISSRMVKRINSSDADVVNLHWVQGETLSIPDVVRIKKPIVWTLHDMWAFCGAEHYTDDYRWRDGYTRANRPKNETGFDINRWVWNRKRRHWKNSFDIVCPSRWLGNRAKESVLLGEWPTTIIPYPIDTDSWKPMSQPVAREGLHLPKGVPLLLFGAMGGKADPRKGFELMQQALRSLLANPRAAGMGIELVIFGQLSPENQQDFGFPVHYVGHLHDDLSLRALYSSTTVSIVPSLQDNLPNVGIEALSCGTPVVAFDTGGLPDIVDHRINGYLARAFDSEDLALGILWVLERSAPGAKALRTAARNSALAHFSPSKVAERYEQVYQKARDESPWV